MYSLMSNLKASIMSNEPVQTVLVNLNDCSGDTYLFLATPKFKLFAESLPHQFFVAGMGPGKSRPSSMNVSLPQDVQDSLVPLLEGPEPLANLLPWEISIGSAENDAYIYLINSVKTFETYGDLMEYALLNNFDVDEKNGFSGVMY